MNEKIITKYKDFEIEYLEYSNIWSAKIGTSEINGETLLLIKKKIDDFIKKENKSKPIKAFLAYSNWGEEIGESIIITSKTDDNRIWIKNSCGRRSKENPSGCIKDTPENRIKLEELKKCKSEIKKLNEKISESMKTLERINFDEL